MHNLSHHISLLASVLMMAATVIPLNVLPMYASHTGGASVCIPLLDMMQYSSHHIAMKVIRFSYNA